MSVQVIIHLVLIIFLYNIKQKSGRFHEACLVLYIPATNLDTVVKIFFLIVV